jgi:hypothetical protein
LGAGARRTPRRKAADAAAADAEPRIDNDCAGDEDAAAAAIQQGAQQHQLRRFLALIGGQQRPAIIMMIIIVVVVVAGSHLQLRRDERSSRLFSQSTIRIRTGALFTQHLSMRMDFCVCHQIGSCRAIRVPIGLLYHALWLHLTL